MYRNDQDKHRASCYHICFHRGTSEGKPRINAGRPPCTLSARGSQQHTGDSIIYGPFQLVGRRLGAPCGGAPRDVRRWFEFDRPPRTLGGGGTRAIPDWEVARSPRTPRTTAADVQPAPRPRRRARPRYLGVETAMPRRFGRRRGSHGFWSGTRRTPPLRSSRSRPSLTGTPRQPRPPQRPIPLWPMRSHGRDRPARGVKLPAEIGR